jgi:uncharacterized protein YecE (DUF72 family)
MIYIGTSGFSYDDWKGHFYPERIATKDMLSYYAATFKAVEINSTYYAIPPAAMFTTMSAKTPDDFRFAVKANKDMTHTSYASDESFLAFLRSIQPLRDSGKLGCILAQFPWSFKPTSENFGRLREFRKRVGDLPTVVEFRNSAWISEDTFAMLRDLGLGFCSVDEPRLKGLIPPIAAATSAIGYVRFHGRNAAKWFKHDQAYERYDYLYSEEELNEWVPKVKDIESKTVQTYVFFNNHYQGKSVRNAMMFAKLLGLSLPLDTHSSVGSDQLTFDVDF